MHKDTYNGIAYSKAMTNLVRNKHFLSWNKLHTRKGQFNFVLILWFDSNISDRRIETIRKKLISYNNSPGEIIDKPEIIKFYNCKQLVLS